MWSFSIRKTRSHGSVPIIMIFFKSILLILQLPEKSVLQMLLMHYGNVLFQQYVNAAFLMTVWGGNLWLEKLWPLEVNQVSKARKAHPIHCNPARCNSRFVITATLGFSLGFVSAWREILPNGRKSTLMVTLEVLNQRLGKLSFNDGSQTGQGSSFGEHVRHVITLTKESWEKQRVVALWSFSKTDI